LEYSFGEPFWESALGQLLCGDTLGNIFGKQLRGIALGRSLGEQLCGAGLGSSFEE